MFLVLRWKRTKNEREEVGFFYFSQKRVEFVTWIAHDSQDIEIVTETQQDPIRFCISSFIKTWYIQFLIVSLSWLRYCSITIKASPCEWKVHVFRSFNGYMELNWPILSCWINWLIEVMLEVVFSRSLLWYTIISFIGWLLSLDNTIPRIVDDLLNKQAWFRIMGDSMKHIVHRN